MSLVSIVRFIFDSQPATSRERSEALLNPLLHEGMWCNSAGKPAPGLPAKVLSQANVRHRSGKRPFCYSANATGNNRFSGRGAGPREGRRAAASPQASILGSEINSGRDHRSLRWPHCTFRIVGRFVGPRQHKDSHLWRIGRANCWCYLYGPGRISSGEERSVSLAFFPIG